MRKILTLLYTAFLMPCIAFSQSVKPVEGLSDTRDLVFVLTNVNVVVEPGKMLENTRLSVFKGRVLSVGPGTEIPTGAVVYDMKGRYVYPSFIEIASEYGLPDSKQGSREKKGNIKGQSASGSNGIFSWNQAIHPETDAAAQFESDSRQAAEWRKFGFGATVSMMKDGIARGTAVLALTGDEPAGKMVLRDKVLQGLSFNKGTSTQDYPSSLMGSIALLRQTYLDARWYSTATEKDYNASLEAWNRNRNLPVLFEVNDYRSALRAAKIAREFGTTYIIKGAGDEYRLPAGSDVNTFPLVIPLQFPKAYDVSNPLDALNISLAELKHWEMAPANPAVLSKRGVMFAFTTDGLKDKKDMMPAIQRAMSYGLSSEKALAALTTIPASLMGLSDQLGSLTTGKWANFIVCSHDLFKKENQILENWVAGKQYVIRSADSVDFSGIYLLNLDTIRGLKLMIGGNNDAPEWSLKRDTNDIKLEAGRDASQWTLRFEPFKGKGVYRLNGTFDKDSRQWQGLAQSPSGQWMNWVAKSEGAIQNLKKDTVKKDSLPSIPDLWFPSMAYGWDNSTNPLPQPSAVIFKNVTAWTCENEGVLKNASVLMKGGKIISVGKVDEQQCPECIVIDGTGMHLTPGIIDEHSHIAINEGVNEGTQSITSEVRIGDVINPDDINIYRQLAGGVTSSHLLHGSANAIGGQTALIKLRWGKSAEEMKFGDNDPFIKFALGENVKQTNWGDHNVTRYPQTRMGVEQIYMDAFNRAREYDAGWKKFSAMKKPGAAPRRDLELEALAEILNKKRFITCHSYQQGEINMLMHVADSFGFRVNTFTHILEGYKVADKMKKHGAGGSSFADWWAYKYEVIDAIPYNGALMHRSGIVTAFNSDDAEMARRLNQEAAKAVKYGGVSEEEALKFVTLNPAILLHIDHRVGSIKAGKDADLVLWNGPPLSVYSKPVKTFVDGICYYDVSRDLILRERNEKERARLIRKMIDEKNSGAPVQKPVTTLNHLYHCNDMETLPH